MGTRADFYVGRGKDAEWLGSVAWDGYPEGMPQAMLIATDEAAFRSAVAKELGSRNDATMPRDGWPWPWDNSATTDYAYCFDGGRVWGSGFGKAWWHAGGEWSDEAESYLPRDEGTPVEWPDMSGRKSVAFGARSGVFIVAG